LDHPIDLSINDIKHRRTRNILRGLINRTVTSDGILHTINNLRKETPIDEIDSVARIVLTNPLFNSLHLVDDFPTTPRLVHPVTRFAEQPLEHELTFQTARISLRATSVHSAINDLNALNAAIFSTDEERIITHFEHFTERHGHSLLLLRNFFFFTRSF
jgi:hypothetical protein